MTAEGPQGPALRQHVRVPVGGVRAAIRIEETEDWIHVHVGDLSLGGGFLLTERYIVEGTRLDIGFEFPSGTQLFLLAEIARAVPATPHAPPGLGVRFVDPPAAAISTIAAEMTGQVAGPGNSGPHAASTAVASQAASQGYVDPGAPMGGPGLGGPGLGSPPPPPVAAPADPSGELTVTLYERLRVDPSVDDAALANYFDQFIASVVQQISMTPAGSAQHKQLQIFQTAMERLRPLTRDSAKRLAYDFHNGFARADERIAAAQAGTGPSLEVLNKSWTRVKTKEVRQAKQLVMASRKPGADAAALLQDALVLDPFNEQILHERQKLQLKANLRQQLLGGGSAEPAAPAVPSSSGPAAMGVASGPAVVVGQAADPPVVVGSTAVVPPETPTPAAPVVQPAAPQPPAVPGVEVDVEVDVEASDGWFGDEQSDSEGWFGDEPGASVATESAGGDDPSMLASTSPSAPPPSDPPAQGGGRFTTTSPSAPPPSDPPAQGGGMFTAVAHTEPVPAEDAGIYTAPVNTQPVPPEDAGIYTTPVDTEPVPPPEPSQPSQPAEPEPPGPEPSGPELSGPQSSEPELSAEPAFASTDLSGDGEGHDDALAGLVSDDAAPALMSDEEVAALISEEDVAAMSEEDLAALMSDEDVAALMGDEDVAALMGDEGVEELMEADDFEMIESDDAIALDEPGAAEAPPVSSPPPAAPAPVVIPAPLDFGDDD